MEFLSGILKKGALPTIQNPCPTGYETRLGEPGSRLTPARATDWLWPGLPEDARF